jgi:phosphomannomutase/phosphoglucomutase
LLLVAVVSLAYLWGAHEAGEGRRRMAGGASALAEHVAVEMTRLRGIIESWQRDPDLRAAFREGGGSARLRDLEGELMRRLPGTLGIQLITAEQTSSLEGIPSMSHAGLDLARRSALDGTSSLVEVHKVGQSDMHLALAAPVLSEGGGQALGVVHVALPMSLLPDLGAILGSRGLAHYQQVVGEAVATLPGGSAAPASPPDHVDRIRGTRLRVAVWWMGGRFFDAKRLAQLGGAYLILLSCIGLILWRAHRALRRDLISDCQGFVALADDLVSHRPVRTIRPRIAEVGRWHRAAAGLLRGLQPHRRRGRARASSPDSAGAAPHDGLEGTSLGRDAIGGSPREVDERDLPDAPGAGIRPAQGRPLAEVPAEIFRAYDIRGLLDRQLTPEVMRAIGQAVGSEASAQGDRTVVVGRDCRASSPGLSAALVDGIRAAGLDVVDLGVVPTPLVYFACCQPSVCSGAVVTASHNPPEYNGVKVVIRGASLQADGVQALYQRIRRGSVSSGSGGYSARDGVRPYLDHVSRDVTLARGLKLIIDCGKGTAAAVAPTLYRTMGCEVVTLNCDPARGADGPMADPSLPEATRALADLVVGRGADLGLAFDGDGDRLGVVDSSGHFIAADRVLMLLAADVLTRHPGTDVIFDVKCTRHLADVIRHAGGRPIMWRSGHAPLKNKLRESDALIAGELSGHIIFKERWFGFDDAIYAGARLIEVLSLDPRPTREIFAALPEALTTPELALELPEGESPHLMQRIMQFADRLEGVDLIRLDGLRAEFDRGWGLVRASNTQPKLTFRFEGDDPEALERIQTLFRRLMEQAAPGLSLPF